jgi:HEAT repeat protein
VALAELQDPAAVEPLLRATRDSDQSVRSQAGAALDRLGTTAVIIGVAALLRPMVEEAAKAAEPESNGRPQRMRANARSQVRSHAPNGRTPEAPDPQPSEQHGPPPGSPTL